MPLGPHHCVSPPGRAPPRPTPRHDPPKFPILRVDDPLRLRDATIGTLNLLRSSAGAAPEETISAAQAFADVATIGILHERTLRESAILSEQLQAALNSRIIIEQAKGVVSHTRGVSIDEAFTLMREYARSHSMGLSIVAARLVDHSLRL